MVHIGVAGNDYQCFDNWEEMTCEKGIELSKVAQTIPQTLKSIYTEIQKGEDNPEYIKLLEGITIEERIKDFPAFYGRVLQVLTNIPEEIINHIDYASRTVFYNAYCQPFVFSVLFYPINYTLKKIPSFEYKGETYPLPETKTILGHDKPMAGITAIEFSEVADLQVFAHNLQGGKFEVAPNVISILCRPVGEEYDEQTCLDRAEEFKQLPMSIVWEVFFCLIELMTISKQHTVISLLQERLKGQKLRVV